MSTKESEKIEGLEELGKIFTFDFDIIKDFIVQSSIKKLQEIIKQDIQLAGIIMMVPETKKAVFLLSLPTDKGKTILISPQEEDAKLFYEAFSSMKKRG